MEFKPEFEAVLGAKALRDWFGHWPSFHDAEIVELYLHRRSVSSMKIYIWEATKEFDDRSGCNIIKDVVVEFAFKGISLLSLNGFNHQNVILGLTLEKTEQGFKLILDDCFGLSGLIEAEEISIRFEPGKPKDAHS